MIVLRRLQLVHALNEEIRQGQDPYPRLKREYEFWESSENTFKGGAEELCFLDEVLRTLLANRPAKFNSAAWFRRLDRGAPSPELMSA